MYWIREHLKVDSKQSGLWVPQIIFQESLLQELFSFFKQSFQSKTRVKMQVIWKITEEIRYMTASKMKGN